jgi:hypothetical protein
LVLQKKGKNNVMRSHKKLFISVPDDFLLLLQVVLLIFLQ